METWRKVPSYPNYRVSNEGRIMNKHCRIMKPQLINGYKCVRVGGGTKRIHRFIAEAFNLPKGPDATVVNHKDQNKLNNHVDNLEWVSQQENMRQYYEHCSNQGKAIMPQRLGFFKEETGEVLIFNSYCEATKHFGVSLANLWGAVQDCWNSDTRKFHGYVVRKLDKDNNVVE